MIYHILIIKVNVRVAIMAYIVNLNEIIIFHITLLQPQLRRFQIHFSLSANH